MKIIALYFLFLFAFCRHYSSFAQEDFRSRNVKLLDSIKGLFNPICQSLSSSRKIVQKEIKYDMKLLELMNELYSSNLTINEIHDEISKVKRGKWDFDSSDLKGTILYQTALPVKGNLHLIISFATFHNRIVFKEIAFNTVTHTNCAIPINYSLSPQDLNYLSTVCFSNLNFPLHFCWNCELVRSDTIFYHMLQECNDTNYILFTNDSAKIINYLTWHDINIYEMDYANEYIKILVKRKELIILKQLLFSPNHILGIYAMEALIYLVITESEILPDRILKKMDDIKKSPIQFAYQYSDVVIHKRTYEQLRISTNQIIAKFKN